MTSAALTNGAGWLSTVVNHLDAAMSQITVRYHILLCVTLRVPEQQRSVHLSSHGLHFGRARQDTSFTRASDLVRC